MAAISDGQKLKFYLDENDQWRWQRLATNGRKLGNPGESFSDFRAALDDANLNYGVDIFLSPAQHILRCDVPLGDPADGNMLIAYVEIPDPDAPDPEPAPAPDPAADVLPEGELP